MALKVERFESPAGGMNTNSAPDYLAANEAAYLENVLCREGAVVARGGITRMDAALNKRTGNLGILGSLHGATKLFIAVQQGVDTAVTPQGYILDLVAQTWAASGPANLSAAQTPITRGVFLSDGTAGYSYAVNQNHKITLYDDSRTVPIEQYFPDAGAYVAALATHQNRLFALTNQATTAQPPAIRWSDPGGPLSIAARWQDDYTGLDNVIYMDARADRGVALTVAGRRLIVLRQKSMWVLTGDTPQTYTFHKAYEVGGIHADAVCEVDDGAYFLSPEGMFFTDGTSVRLVSGPVQDLLVPACRKHQLIDTDPIRQRLQCSLTYLGNGLVQVLMVSRGATFPVASTVDFSGLYDTRRGTWSLLTSSVFPCATATKAPWSVVPVPVGSIPGSTLLNNRALLWGDNEMFTTSGIVCPEDTATRDMDYSGAYQPVTATVKSRLARLANPTNRVQLHRLLAEAITASGGWTTSIVDGLGNTLVTGTPAGGAAPNRSRAIADVFQETADLQLVSSLSLNSATAGLNKLLDQWVEYQPAAPQTG